MIKFFRGELSGISGQFGANNIVFVTDRNTINLDGVEYGKDQFKSVATSAAILTDKAAAGTIYYVEGEQALYKKTAADAASVILPSVSGQVAELKEALSATISTAFAANKVTVGTTTGITASDYVIDTTTGSIADISTALTATLVNAATLSAAIDDINQANAKLSAGNGIGINEGSAAAGGKVWTVSTAIDTTASSLLAYNASGEITTDIKIKKLDTATTGYAASYQLVTTRNNTETVLGETINITKNQLLQSATYVAAPTTQQGDTITGEVSGADIALHPEYDRYLKLVFFADENGNGEADAGEATNTVYINVNELFDSYTGVSGVAVNAGTNQISAVVDPTSESFFTNSAAGLKVSGVSAAISTAIQGLSSDAGTADQYVTAIGVKADGTLSAATAQISAGQVAFDNTNTTSLEAATVQAAIDELAADVAGGFGSLSAAQVGSATQYITSISQTSGVITATAADLTADKVAFGESSNVSAALTGLDANITAVSTYIDGLDLTATASGAAPSSGNDTKYSIVNTVGQTDGKVAATTLDLTAANTYQAGDTQVLTGTSAAVSVGVTQGSVQAAIEELANKIADFGSFHDGSGNVINS